MKNNLGYPVGFKYQLPDIIKKFIYNKSKNN